MSLVAGVEKASVPSGRWHRGEVNSSPVTCYATALSNFLLLVVKLFNVIQTAQQSGTQAASESSSVRGTGKASLPAPTAEGFRTEKKKAKGKAQKDNVIGRAKPGTISSIFFHIVWYLMYSYSCAWSGRLPPEHPGRGHCLEGLIRCVIHAIHVIALLCHLKRRHYWAHASAIHSS